jgi:hypothetical protein
MAMEYASVQIELATLLRSRPHGTTADINSHTVAYWDGHEVRGFRLRHDDYCERLEEEFAFDERTCNHLHADLVAWMAAPRYTVRSELEHWLKGAPWMDAGS